MPPERGRMPHHLVVVVQWPESSPLLQTDWLHPVKIASGERFWQQPRQQTSNAELVPMMPPSRTCHHTFGVQEGEEDDAEGRL